jgi:hypothetical protein
VLHRGVPLSGEVEADFCSRPLPRPIPPVAGSVLFRPPSAGRCGRRRPVPRLLQLDDVAGRVPIPRPLVSGCCDQPAQRATPEDPPPLGCLTISGAAARGRRRFSEAGGRQGRPARVSL